MSLGSVLCVDDDPFIVELYTMAIGGDATVLSAGSAEDAMPLVEKADAIVLDLGLPGMSGAEFLKWIRERSDAPILVVTGEESADVYGQRSDGSGMEGVTVHTKPVPIPTLKAWVRASVQ